MEDELPSDLEPITKKQALALITKTEGRKVYKNDMLLHRWDERVMVHGR